MAIQICSFGENGFHRQERGDLRIQWATYFEWELEGEIDLITRYTEIRGIEDLDYR